MARDVRNAKLTMGILAVATVVVAGFGGLNLYSALGIGSKGEEVAHAASEGLGDTLQVVLPVESMISSPASGESRRPWRSWRALWRRRGLLLILWN